MRSSSVQCSTIHNVLRYGTFPKIADQKRKLGIHPKVCCPHSEVSGWRYPPVLQSPQSSSAPPMSARSCNIDGANSVLPELTECVSLDRCDKLLDSQLAPIGPVQVCGFQEADQKMMICCPEELITEPTVRPLVAGRMDGRTSQKQYELAASVVLLFRGSVT